MQDRLSELTSSEAAGKSKETRNTAASTKNKSASAAGRSSSGGRNSKSNNKRRSDSSEESKEKEVSEQESQSEEEIESNKKSSSKKSVKPKSKRRSNGSDESEEEKERKAVKSKAKRGSSEEEEAGQKKGKGKGTGRKKEEEESEPEPQEEEERETDEDIERNIDRNGDGEEGENNEAGEDTVTGFENDEYLKDFFVDVKAIKAGMTEIRKSIKAIEESYGQSLVAVGVDQGMKSSEELEKLIDGTNLAATDVRNRLKEMDKENKKLQSTDKGTAQFRIRVNMHGTLTRKFLDLMAEYQEVQTKYKNKFRERVERQFRIVKPEATQDEIDEALETGNTQIFAQEILSQRHTQAKDALNYIENRHKDIIRLEQSIKELHQLFLDMAILVESQGELIDQIEYNVNQSVAYTKEAVKQLRGANKLQKKSRKKMCCLVVILLIVIILLGGGGIIAGVTVGNHSAV